MMRTTFSKVFTIIRALKIRTSNGRDTISMWKAKYAKETARETDPVAYSAMKSIFAELPVDSTVITDIGSNMVWTLQSMQLKPGQRLFSNFGNASMGVGVTSRHWRCDWKQKGNPCGGRVMVACT
jgi:thiamine pyrophosphate-dependent acetolactate synthase large subunit-like protein